MNLLSPGEIMTLYTDIGARKAAMQAWRLLALGVVAGFVIGMGAAVTQTATHAIANPSLARVVSGLLFPFGLGIVMLLGAELFTGNCMMLASVMAGKATVGGILRNWALVYIGNFIGGTLLAAACVYGGMPDHGAGGLAVQMIRTAAFKCELSYWPAVVLGVLCNILVCMGLLCSLSAKDTAGRIMGAYLPVAFFVICGFEHSVANMYFIPAGLLARLVPRYEELALQAGVSLESLTWSRFLLSNLVPVTLGNILGGAGLAALLWKSHVANKQTV